MRLPKLDLQELGKELAHSDDDEQSAFLNALGQELAVGCRGGKYETQVCYISDKLDHHGEELIQNLAAFVALRRKAKAEQGAK